MSMNITHFVGYYFRCEKKDLPEELFPDESFFRVFDEGGSKSINDFHVYLPNRECAGCFSLDKWSETGLLGVDDDSPIPDEILQAGKRLESVYEQAELRYGIVSYVN